MNTFLKIVLIAVLVLIAIKLSPFFLLAAAAGLAVATALGALGLSLIALLAAVVLALAVALSPIWVTVLIALGLVSLFKRADRRVPPTAA